MKLSRYKFADKYTLYTFRKNDHKKYLNSLLYYRDHSTYRVPFTSNLVLREKIKRIKHDNLYLYNADYKHYLYYKLSDIRYFCKRTKIFEICNYSTDVSFKVFIKLHFIKEKLSTYIVDHNER